MASSSRFYFYNSLNDFLPRSKKNVWITYPFNDSPAVKDAIEAIGIPHPEVNRILINDVPVSFFHPLEDGAQVQVYPVSEQDSLTADAQALSPNDLTPLKFILDVHLGSLAKMLRLLGFDTLYENDYDDSTIVQIAATEQRIVLTRDVGLLKHKLVEHGYWLRAQHLKKQVMEVFRRFRLALIVRPFERCLACNGLIEKVSKESVLEKVPPNTITYFDDFYECASCKRVYWKGSHYQQMRQTVQQIFEELQTS